MVDKLELEQVLLRVSSALSANRHSEIAPCPSVITF
jgi:hypothetical protein